jgi:hypothetical protein
MNRHLILLPTALFIFCAGCSSPKPNEPPKPGKYKGHKLVGNVLAPYSIPEDAPGIDGYLRVKLHPDSPIYATTWRYRLAYPQGPWVPAASPYYPMGQKVQLTANANYDVKFYTSPGNPTVDPNPKEDVTVYPDQKTVLEVFYY